jgi:hypothetical protein
MSPNLSLPSHDLEKYPYFSEIKLYSNTYKKAISSQSHHVNKSKKFSFLKQIFILSEDPYLKVKTRVP